MRPGLPVPVPLPHVGIDPVGALVSALGRAVTGGVQSVAAYAFDHMTAALLATTQVSLDGWFAGPWRAMLAVAAVLGVPILLAGVISEVLAGQPGQALRRGVALPLLIGPVLLAARAALGLLLAVVNAGCALVVQLGIGGPGGFAAALDRMRGVFGVTAQPGIPGSSGVALVVVVLVAAVLAAVIWVELAVRAALVYLLVAFIPLALAGLFWSATARWTRRLVEVLAAVILAQLVITVVMVLAAAALAEPAHGVAPGIDAVAVGLALLFLGSLGLPLTFRVIPHVIEAAAVTGAGAAVAGRVRRGGSQLLAAAPTPAARFAAAGGLAAPPPRTPAAAAAAATTAGSTPPPPPPVPRRAPVARPADDEGSRP